MSTGGVSLPSFPTLSITDTVDSSSSCDPSKTVPNSDDSLIPVGAKGKGVSGGSGVSAGKRIWGPTSGNDYGMIYGGSFNPKSYGHPNANAMSSTSGETSSFATAASRSFASTTTERPSSTGNRKFAKIPAYKPQETEEDVWASDDDKAGDSDSDSEGEK
jgi:hypothetical protein